MNILHMKYAVEVAKTGSLSAASESLIIAQPNLSRAIKSLEADLGITIFDRSPRGMILTDEGREFLEYANSILDKIDDVEAIYRTRLPVKNRFSVSVPRADYISRAFVGFSSKMEKGVECVYRESDNADTLTSVLRGDCKLGILRYADIYDKQFKTLFREKGLVCEALAEFRLSVIASEKSSVASLHEVRLSDLQELVEISYADHFVPMQSADEVRKAVTTENTAGRICVCDRASALELVSSRTDTFMRSSVPAGETVEAYGLAVRDCLDDRRVWRDVCVYRKGYRMTDLDRTFLEEVKTTKGKFL